MKNPPNCNKRFQFVDEEEKSTPKRRTNAKVLSPLQKKLVQENIESRSKRLTPELPKIKLLTINVDDEADIESPVFGVDYKKEVSPIAISRSNSGRVLSPTIHRSPSHRRLRVKTLEENSLNGAIASAERMKRNTDSMLEDALIANKLKRRLISRRKVGISRRTIDNTGLSDFIKKSIMDGSLDALSVVRPSDEQLSGAADIALKCCFEGYFDDIHDEDIKSNARNIFLSSLIREEFYENDVIYHEQDIGDKIFVIEEGIAEFSTGGQVVGTIQDGSIFGELSLIYGTPRCATAKAATPSLMLWSLDAISFRKIQAIAANEALKASSKPKSRSDKLKQFRRQCSSLSDLQEQSNKRKLQRVDLESLKHIAIIGKGTFGSVYLVSQRIDAKAKMKHYALKGMSKASIVERNNTKRVLIEKNVLQELDSNFIITLYGTNQDESSVYFLTDFVQGGNLMNYMVHKDILSHSECIFFTANIVSALVHIHKRGIVHRDLKPENCLIDRNGYLKICDFGMAKRLPSIVQLPNGGTEVVTLAFTMCGTPEFMAPEFVLSTGYDKAVDIWALGCILVEMYIGRSPFEFDGRLKETFREVCLIGMEKKAYCRPEALQKEGFVAAGRFSEQLLASVQNRLGKDDTATLKSHDYFQDLDFDLLNEQKIEAPYLPYLSHASDVSHFERDVDHVSYDDQEIFDGDSSWCKDF